MEISKAFNDLVDAEIKAKAALDDARLDMLLAKRQADETAFAVAKQAEADALSKWVEIYNTAKKELVKLTDAIGVHPDDLKRFG